MSTIRPLALSDRDAVLALYRAAAAEPNSGLARTPDEMDAAYVEGFLGKALADAVSLGVFAPDGALQGEIHAARMGPRQFAHVLTDLTVAVHPDARGRGLGTRLFEALFAHAARLTPRIERVELVAREGNAAAIRLYERLGFEIEGRFRGRVRLPDGTVEDDVPMGRAL